MTIEILEGRSEVSFETSSKLFNSLCLFPSLFSDLSNSILLDRVALVMPACFIMQRHGYASLFYYAET